MSDPTKDSAALDSVIGRRADGTPYTVRDLVGTDAKLMASFRAEARSQALAEAIAAVEGLSFTPEFGKMCLFTDDALTALRALRGS